MVCPVISREKMRRSTRKPGGTSTLEHGVSVGDSTVCGEDLIVIDFAGFNF